MHPHPLLLVAAHVVIAADDEATGAGDEADVASAMEGVQLSDGGGGSSLLGPSGAHIA